MRISRRWQSRSAGLLQQKCAIPLAETFRSCGKNGKHQGCRAACRRGDRDGLGDAERVGSGQRGDPAARMGGGEAVGYSPNAIARSLRLGKSRLIGIGHRRHHQSVLLPSMVRTMEKRRSRRATRSSCATPTTTPSANSPMLAQLRAQHVAGILLMPLGRGADYVQPSPRHNLPPMSPSTNACRAWRATSSASTTAPPRAC